METTLQLALCLGLLVVPSARASITETGDVVVTGPTKNVGDTGVGSLTVDNGSNAIEGGIIFGNQATGDGTGGITLTGDGTSLSANDRLFVGWGLVGQSAQGLLDVGRGALVEVGGNNAGVGSGNFALTATVVPEPASLVLLGLGGLALFGRRGGSAVFQLSDPGLFTGFVFFPIPELFRCVHRRPGTGSARTRCG